VKLEIATSLFQALFQEIFIYKTTWYIIYSGVAPLTIAVSPCIDHHIFDLPYNQFVSSLQFYTSCKEQ
jgi:hypothetical protein